VTFHRGFPIHGDLELTADGRDLVLLSGAAKVAQSIRVGAQIFKGSWRYDRSAGIPYFQEILVAGPQLELVRRRFHEFLTRTPGVAAVTSLTLRHDRASATIYVDFHVVVETGEILTDTLDFVAVS
jgi:hypothetical protein